MLMSGGVDSSVAAQLLFNANIDFDPFYIKISNEDKNNEYSCSQEEDVEMATAVCHKFGKKLQIIDLHNEYWENVVGYHFDKVKHGLTPNPDVMCNTLIKFGAFIDKVGKNYDRIASGHYGRIAKGDDPNALIFETLDNCNTLQGKTWLVSGVDPIKDQTDFLCMLNNYQLSKIMLPIGHLTKQEVREIAEKYHLAPAHRKDSQGICFLGKINYNEYILKHLGKKEGNIIDYHTNNIIGKHNGYWFHTIGQRKGLYLSGGPWFVIKKDVENNIVYVTNNQNDLTVNTLYLNPKSVYWFNDCFETVFPHSYNLCNVRIRHTSSPSKAIIEKTSDNNFLINVSNGAINSAAPGQFCVIYSTNGVVLGAGEISF